MSEQLTRNFSRDEFGDVPPALEGNVAELAELLQRIRDLVNASRTIPVPIIVTSCYRTPEHNAAVGGAPNSEHLEARAADVEFVGLSNRGLLEIVQAAERAGTMPGYGQLIVYDDDLHVHISLPRIDGRPNGQQLLAYRDDAGARHYSQVATPSDVPAISTAAKRAGLLALLVVGGIAAAGFLRPV